MRNYFALILISTLLCFSFPKAFCQEAGFLSIDVLENESTITDELDDQAGPDVEITTIIVQVQTNESSSNHNSNGDSNNGAEDDLIMLDISSIPVDANNANDSNVNSESVTEPVEDVSDDIDDTNDDIDNNTSAESKN